MNRRTFLRRVVGGFVAAAAVPLLPARPVVDDREVGIAIRFIRKYDIRSNSRPCRSDVFYGAAALRPKLACRVSA